MRRLLLCLVLCLCANARAATFTVTKTADTGDGTCNADCSLREAIGAANGAAGDDTIGFAVGVVGTIQLGSVLPDLSTNINLQGPGANLLTVEENDTNKSFAIFKVLDGVSASFSGLTVAKGFVGIYNFGTATITNCTANGNDYGFDNFTNGNPTNPMMTVTGCAVRATANTGIFSDGTVTVTNTTVTGNNNGIVINIGSTATIANCTVSGNSNYGIYNPGAAATIKNTIATNNPTGDVSGGASGTFVSGGYNFIGDGSAAPGFVNGVNGDQVGTSANRIDAQLGALADNGGPTQTMALLLGSRAINNGDPAYSGPLTTDQRGTGFPRVQGTRLDIGAFEAPLLSVNDVSHAEGNSGSTAFDFTVTLSAPSAQTVTVDWATTDPTSPIATAGSDYTAVPTTTLTFAPGETTKTATVLVNGDTLNETLERFRVLLSNASGATIATRADGEGFGTIVNDDAVPSLSINDVTQAEGNPAQGAPGTTAFIFTVTLSAPSSKTVTVKVATATPTGNPATAGVDYTALPLTTLTFNPGETTKTVTVLVNGDMTVEGNEKFAVRLSNSANASIAKKEGFGTITNDDAAALLFEEDAPSE